MQAGFRKVAVFVGAAAIAGGVAAGVASQGGADASTSSRAIAQDGAGRPGPRGGMDLSALADALGVSTAKLQDALEAARPTGDPGARPPGADGEDPMAAALAEQLGLSTAKVQEALESFLPPAGPGGAPPDGSIAPDPPSSTGSTSDATPA